MADAMTFPKTVDEFMEQYKIVDVEEVYTNGAELVPIFRMKQWFEHSDKHGKWHNRYYYRKASNSYDCEVFVCGECQAEFSYDAETGVQASDWHYCPNCGARMDIEE